MSSYTELELAVIRWSEQRRIIPNSTPLAQWIKACEELHELREAISMMTVTRPLMLLVTLWCA